MLQQRAHWSGVLWWQCRDIDPSCCSSGCPVPPGTVSQSASPPERRGCASIGAVWCGGRGSVIGRDPGARPSLVLFPIPCFVFPLAYHRSGGLVLESHLEFLLGRRRMFGLLTYQSGQLSRGEEPSGRLLPVVCRSRLPPSLVRRRTLRASWASAGVTIWKAWVARSETALR